MNQLINQSERTTGSLSQGLTSIPHKALHLVLGLCIMGLFACAGEGNKSAEPAAGPGDASDTSIKVPSGFTASTVVEGFGRVRHIVVAPNGVIFVKLNRLKDGKGIYRLQDTNGDGKPEQITGFGNFTGTGIAIKNGYLYASSDEDVYRYKLDANFNV